MFFFRRSDVWTAWIVGKLVRGFKARHETYSTTLDLGLARILPAFACLGAVCIVITLFLLYACHLILVRTWPDHACALLKKTAISNTDIIVPGFEPKTTTQEQPAGDRPEQANTDWKVQKFTSISKQLLRYAKSLRAFEGYRLCMCLCVCAFHF